MWTKRNDHALKSECDDFFNICSKREVLKNKNKIKFNHSFVFSYLRLLFPQKKNHESFISNNISLPWALASFLP
jgi:hypothetical protein